MAAEATGETIEEGATEPATVASAAADLPTEEAAIPDVVSQSAPKTKRRWWFRGRSAATSEDATVEAQAPDEQIAPGDTAESAGVEAESGAVEEFPTEGPDDTKPAAPAARKPVGRRMAIATAVVATLFVAAGAFGGAMLQPYLADRALAQTKVEIARTATTAITTLFTYTPEDMDRLSARSAKYLGGDLKDSYAKQVDALVATNKQNQIHRNAQVVGAAVESVNGPTATAMVYANVTYTSAATKDAPKLFLVSYRLTMQRKGSDWVITNMPWITSKDLTRVTP
jgi:Mce-associated membrane protein